MSFGLQAGHHGSDVANDHAPVLEAEERGESSS